MQETARFRLPDPVWQLKSVNVDPVNGTDNSQKNTDKANKNGTKTGEIGAWMAVLYAVRIFAILLSVWAW